MSMEYAFSGRKLARLAAMLVVVALCGLAAWWIILRPVGNEADLVSGNGRLEATEINVSTTLGGRVSKLLVREGAFVKAGAPLAIMNTNVLTAQREEAEARRRQALASVASDRARVAMRKSEFAAAKAGVVRAQSDLDVAERHLARTEPLTKTGAYSLEDLDYDRARVKASRAALNAARAQAVSAQAAVTAARTQVAGAKATVAAAAATVARIDADIRDSTLVSPQDGRVQYRMAEPGEVLAPGAPVLNIVDLADVYMTFFLPEAVAGRVALGSDVRLILDAAPSYVIPAKVTYVSATAQFTPKSVETASEREKLMFRVKARIDPALLRRHLTEVKTGLPGVAWVKLNPSAPWPPRLKVRVP